MTPFRAWFLFLVVLLTACGREVVGYSGIDVTGANFGREFTLSDPEGHERTLADFRGKFVLLFFGFTQCPNVCPTALARAAEVRKQLGADAAKVQVIFVTVDPERDTPQVMQDYAGSFGGAITGLSGSPQAIGAVEKAYRVFSRTGTIQSDGGYSMDHSSIVYVMSKTGGFVEALNLDRPPDETARELERLL